MDIKIVLEEQEGGEFTVSVPSLPGCVSEGETLEESMKNIKEAIELYLDSEEDYSGRGKIMNLKI